MQTLLQNVRYSLRVLRKNPGLTLTVLLTLALGIGANTAIFTVDYATLLAPLPYPNPDQLVVVWSKIQDHHNGVAAGDFTDWRRQNTVFEDMCAWTGGSFNIATHDQPEYIEGRRTTPGFYKMLGYRFLMGRDFLPEEGEVGRNHEVILMYKLWKRLGSNSHIVGTTMLVDGEPHTVVGVLAPGMADRGQGEMVTPIAFRPEQVNHDFHWLLVMARMKPGVTLQQARENMNAVTAAIAQAYPKSDKGWGAYVEPLKNDFLPSERITTLWLLLGAVGFILLIACVNVANLLLANDRFTLILFVSFAAVALLLAALGIYGVMAFSVAQRSHEIALRMALGASRNRVVGMVVREGVLLACYLPARRAASVHPMQVLRME